jgi:putative NADPH-quinone reductase
MNLQTDTLLLQSTPWHACSAQDALAALESMWRKLLAGKSARVVVTMGMPAFVYRWYFGAHSLKSLECNILGFCGIGPIKETLIGMIEAPNSARRQKWLAKMRQLGRAGR